MPSILEFGSRMILMRPRAFVQVLIGRLLHLGGNLQRAVESHHWPEPAVESELELEPVLIG